jgi:hypothetical protein
VVKLLNTNEKEAMFPFADMVVFQDMNWWEFGGGAEKKPKR